MWSKNEDELDLDFIRKLIRVYLFSIRLFYPMSCYTLNNHQLNHVIEQFENHGRHALNNGFLFEHFNGVTSVQVHSGFGVLEQISERSNLLQSRNIKFANVLHKVRSFRTNSASADSVTRIENDHLFVISSVKNKKNKSKDHFVMTHDNKFFQVLEIYKTNNTLRFKSKPFKIVNEFSLNLDFSSEINLELLRLCDDFFEVQFENLDFDYMFHVELQTKTVDLHVNEIKEKVLYCPKFAGRTSKFADRSKGLIMRDRFVMNN